MRKIYIKPMMNSEEFVTNEYIAVCYTVECKGHVQGDYQACGTQVIHLENDITFGSDNLYGTGASDDGFFHWLTIFNQWGSLNDESKGYYTGSINGIDPVNAHKGEDNNWQYAHKVEVSKNHS